jgi:hypothetical protein
MKKLCSVLLVLVVGGAAAPAWAGGSYRGPSPCASRVVYVQAPPAVYVPFYGSAGQSVRSCDPRRGVSRGVIYAPRMMAQPGYWVYRDMGCGRIQRAWQPSRRVTVPSHHGAHFVRAGW